MSQTAYTHCPNCFAEYRVGYTICQDCGSILEPGPSPIQQRTEPEPPGGIQVVERTEDGSDATTDRFGLEEVPVVLTTIVEEDADDFLAALDDQEIGARRGEPAGDGGVEIVVHAANLIDAQAALVEFTGDVRLVDDIGLGEAGDAWGDEAAMAVVTWSRLQDVGAQANRLRAEGIDVRLELPQEAERDAAGAQAALLVSVDELARAREILGIEA